MIHHRRRFNVEHHPSIAAMVERMRLCSTWCLCQGFEAEGVILLNDAFSEDGAQEYAAFKTDDAGELVQVDSITVSWCSPAELLPIFERIRDAAIADTFWPAGTNVPELGIHPSGGACRLCA